MPPSASGATRSSRMTPKSLSSRRVAALVLNSSQRKLKMASGSSPLTSQCATMCGCLPTRESPSSECETGRAVRLSGKTKKTDYHPQVEKQPQYAVFYGNFKISIVKEKRFLMKIAD